jgi:hypothetical protein
MPSSLQYPLERSRALQEKWLRMMQETPPRDEDDEDDEDDENDEDEEEDDNEEKPQPAVIREPNEDE